MAVYSGKSYIVRGENATLTASLGKSQIFPSAPEWVLYDWDDNELNSGVANYVDGKKWQASFTIPVNLQIPEGVQDLTLTFYGETNTGKEVEVSKTVTVVGVLDAESDFGQTWMPGISPINDVLVLNSQPDSIGVRLLEGVDNGKTLMSETVPFDYKGRVGDSHVVTLTLTPPSTVKTFVKGGNPYHLIYTCNYPGGSAQPEIVAKPAYCLTPNIVSRLFSIRQMIDKGRFTDIDQSLQWSDAELCNHIIEGQRWMNAFGTMTAYSIEKTPVPLVMTSNLAAAWFALNARYIAEGFSDFEFQGQSVSLSVNRREVLESRLGELRSMMEDGLAGKKQSAIRQYGPGDDQGNMPSASARNIARLGISLNQVSNYVHRLPYSRYPYHRG